MSGLTILRGLALGVIGLKDAIFQNLMSSVSTNKANNPVVLTGSI